MTSETSVASGRKSRNRDFVPDWAYPLTAIVLIVVFWDLSIRYFNIQSFVLPSPGEVLASLIGDWGEIWPAALFTLYEILIGFGLSVVIGVGLALAIVSNRTVEKTIYPILVGSQVIPKIALAPLFVLWFGFGIAPKILIAFLIAFFPVVISSVVGLRSVEITKLQLLRSMGATGREVFFKLRFPAALPSLFAGLKLSITGAVIGAIVGEFIGADKGIGRVLLIANGFLETDLLFAAVTVLSVIGVILFLIIDFIERIAIRWHVSQRVRYFQGL